MTLSDNRYPLPLGHCLLTLDCQVLVLPIVGTLGERLNMVQSSWLRAKGWRPTVGASVPWSPTDGVASDAAPSQASGSVLRRDFIGVGLGIASVYREHRTDRPLNGNDHYIVTVLPPAGWKRAGTTLTPRNRGKARVYRGRIG